MDDLEITKPAHTGKGGNKLRLGYADPIPEWSASTHPRGWVEVIMKRQERAA
jgi:hypothetical protein